MKVGIREQIMRILLLTLVSLALSSTWAMAAPVQRGVVVSQPELTVLRHGGNESVALPAGSYSSFTVDSAAASFTLLDSRLPAGERRLRGGISHVSWTPGEDGVKVTLTFARPPKSSVINALPGTELRPGVPQVIAGFAFDAPAPVQRPAVGRANVEEQSGGRYGDYQLPRFPDAKYSDALVTLKVHNVDFRDVLWLMSEIGNVSIMLDPYWADEPTGSRRTVGGGADPDGGGGGGHGGGGDAGFRPGDDFIPGSPREGTGNLTMNLNEVPFDLALDLVLQSVGLVKVDVYPGTFD
jgi:hypothetical protein